MTEGRWVAHHGEAIVLRTWPFHEADLVVSLLTREGGVVKGVARHAMRSRRRFGGALEPGTYALAQYAERRGEELARLESLEIQWSPLRAPVDWERMAGLQLVVEVLEGALPDGAPEDHVFRLALAVLQAMEHQPVWLPVTYFCVWMCRLLGCWPEFGHCVVCGLDLRGADVWWSPTADGVTCPDDRRTGSRTLTAPAVLESQRIARTPLNQLLAEGPWPRNRAADLRWFAVAMLERQIDRRLRSAAALG